MYDDILEILHGVWKNGFSLTALGTAVFVLLKQRKVKKRLRRYIPWLLEDDSEVKAYVHNQRLIMERLGIEWDAATLTKNSESTAAKNVNLSESRSATNTIARGAELFIQLRRKTQMSNINKGILLPLLAAIATFVKSVFGYELSDQEIDNYANMILWFLMIIGIFMDFRKKKKKVEPQQLEEVEGYYH